MSVVTNCMLIVGTDVEPVERALAYEGHSGGCPMNLRKLDPIKETGGTKCWEGEIYVGAFNHFDTDGWFRHLDAITALGVLTMIAPFTRWAADPSTEEPG